MSRATLIPLEMTSPDELVAARPPPAPLELEEVGRVWVQTTSDDHPHALPNYLRRGFRPFTQR